MYKKNILRKRFQSAIIYLSEPIPTPIPISVPDNKIFYIMEEKYEEENCLRNDVCSNGCYLTGWMWIKS